MKRSVIGLTIMGMLVGTPAMAETFDQIMASISKAGSLPNGDGHYWSFKAQGQGWRVEGAQGQSATVTTAGENQVKFDGFPRDWGANGVYTFTNAGGNCTLSSTKSRHKLTWKCG